MHRIGRTLVRLSPANRRHVDGLRPNSSVPRERLVNTILRVSLETRQPSPSYRDGGPHDFSNRGSS